MNAASPATPPVGQRRGPARDAAGVPAVRTGSPASRVFGLTAAAAVVLAASMPLWVGPDPIRTLTEFASLVALAQMWNLLAGYAGLVSIGQQAFIGLGAYGLVVFADRMGLPVVAAVPLSALVAAAVAVPIGRLVFRLRGGYFAIGTWVVAEVARLLVVNVRAVGGGSGTTVRAAAAIPAGLRQSLAFWLGLTLAVGATMLVRGILRSRLGLALTAIRDSEAGAASLGVDVARAQRTVWVLAAAGCGAAGAVLYLNLLRVQPNAAFSVNWTAFMIFIVLIGGVGTIEGPIIGSVVFLLLQETLADFGAAYLVVLGIVAVVVTIRAPGGLWGLVAAHRRVDLFAVRRRLEP